MHQHRYDGITVAWTGDLGEGTKNYRAYSRDHRVTGPAGTLDGSADPAFRGDAARWNPEQLLLVSLSQCHMLWYLHLASEAGVVVVGYQDRPTGTMTTDASGGGQFDEVTLHPQVTISAESDAEVARAVHAKVPEVCFIARSVNFPVHHQVQVTHAP